MPGPVLHRVDPAWQLAQYSRRNLFRVKTPYPEYRLDGNTGFQSACPFLVHDLIRRPAGHLPSCLDHYR